MSSRIPIIEIEEFLLVSIQVDMHDRMVKQLQEDLSDRIGETQAKGVVIDISALTVVDSFIGRMIGFMASVARMMDAETVLVGMQPAVAITLVELGMELPAIHTALNLDHGIARLRELLAGRDREGASDYAGT